MTVDTAPPQWLTALELTLLGAIWGGSFLFMRVAAPSFGALALVEVRIVLGALVLLPFLWRARARFGVERWGRLALIAALNSAIPFTLFAWGAERAPAGVGAIANSLAALWTVLVAFVLYRERIGWLRGLAMGIGFVGVVVLMSDRTRGADVAPAAVAGALASLCYGLSSNFTRHWLADLPPVAAVAATMLCAALMLAPLAWTHWPAAVPPRAAWLSAIALGVLCTGVAYAVFFRLIARIGPTRATTSTYLVPLFGVLWGWLVLGERPSMLMLLAGGLILGGVIVSQREGRRAEVPSRAATGETHLGGET